MNKLKGGFLFYHPFFLMRFLCLLLKTQTTVVSTIVSKVNKSYFWLLQVSKYLHILKIIQYEQKFVLIVLTITICLLSELPTIKTIFTIYWPNVAIPRPDQPKSNLDNCMEVWRWLGMLGHTKPTVVDLDGIFP